jgi:hypothetical protein
MIRYCPRCGAELFEGTKFCASCGSIFEEKPAAPVQPISEPMPDGNISQQQTTQPPMYTPMTQSPPHKSKNKLIFAVAAIIIVVMVVVALFFILQVTTSNNDPAKLIGTWDVSSSMMGGMIGGTSSSMGQWTFCTNGSLKMASPLSYSYDHPSISFEQNDTFKTLTITAVSGSSSSSSVQWCTYNAEGGKLQITYPYDTLGMMGSSSVMPAMNYKFSNDNTCTLTFTYSFMTIPITLTRSSEINTNQGTNVTPIEWENVNITVETFETPVRWDSITLTRSPVPYSGASAPSEWGEVTVGDVIQIGNYGEYISGRLMWIPTNSTIDYFWFYT